MRYARILEEIGESGTYQKRLCFLMLIITLSTSSFSILPVHTQYKTAYRCRMDHAVYENETGLEISWNESEKIGYTKNTCEIVESDISNHTFLNDTQKSTNRRPCSTRWAYKDQDTVIAEFNLICNDFWKSALALNLFIVGMGFGSFSGTLSDRFGRRPLFLISTFLLFFTSGVMGFATNFEMYAVCLFFLGACMVVSHNALVTTMSEMIGSRRHGVTMLLILLAWSGGLSISCPIAYLSQNWRWYVRSCSLIGLLYVVPLWRYYPESLRWQIISGRIKDAKRNILVIAKINGKNVDVEILCKKLVNTAELEKNGNLNKDIGYLQACWKSSLLRNRFVILNLNWAVTQLLYFSISLNPITTSNSRFIHVLIVGLAELPGYVFGYIVSKYFGLTWCCGVSIGLGGLVGLIVPFLYSAQPGFLNVATFFGKCFISSSYGYLLLLTAQISPTMMRSTGIGFASFHGKIGGLIMPYLMLIGDGENPSVPYFIMGSLGCFSSLLTLLFIPDSREGMPDTVKEAEENKSNYLQVVWRKLRWTQSNKKQRQQTESNSMEENFPV